MVTLYGELDIHTEPAVRAVLMTAARAKPNVVVDLSQLAFADSTVLNLALWARNSFRPRLAGPLPTQLARLFHVARVESVLTVFPSLAAALEVPGRRPPPLRAAGGPVPS